MVRGKDRFEKFGQEREWKRKKEIILRTWRMEQNHKPKSYK